METIATPLHLVASMTEFRLSPKLKAKLQDFMDRNTGGQLTEPERKELEALGELDDTMALRGEALQVLGRSVSGVFGLFSSTKQ